MHRSKHVARRAAVGLCCAILITSVSCSAGDTDPETSSGASGTGATSGSALPARGGAPDDPVAASNNQMEVFLLGQDDKPLQLAADAPYEGGITDFNGGEHESPDHPPLLGFTPSSGSVPPSLEFDWELKRKGQDSVAEWFADQALGDDHMGKSHALGLWTQPDGGTDDEPTTTYFPTTLNLALRADFSLQLASGTTVVCGGLLFGQSGAKPQAHGFANEIASDVDTGLDALGGDFGTEFFYDLGTSIDDLFKLKFKKENPWWASQDGTEHQVYRAQIGSKQKAAIYVECADGAGAPVWAAIYPHTADNSEPDASHSFNMRFGVT